MTYDILGFVSESGEIVFPGGRSLVLAMLDGLTAHRKRNPNDSIVSDEHVARRLLQGVAGDSSPILLQTLSGR